jgi:hypothetical protein
MRARLAAHGALPARRESDFAFDPAFTCQPNHEAHRRRLGHAAQQGVGISFAIHDVDQGRAPADRFLGHASGRETGSKDVLDHQPSPSPSPIGKRLEGRGKPHVFFPIQSSP